MVTIHPDLHFEFCILLNTVLHLCYLVSPFSVLVFSRISFHHLMVALEQQLKVPGVILQFLHSLVDCIFLTMKWEILDVSSQILLSGLPLLYLGHEALLLKKVIQQHLVVSLVLAGC